MTSHKPKTVGKKGVAVRTSRLKEILQHVRGRQSFCQSCHAFVGRSRSDHSRQQGTQKTSHPRRRLGASLVPAQRQTLPLRSGSLWGAIQCSMLEPHGSSACTPLPPVPFHSTWWMAVCRRFLLVWKRQRHRSWQHAFAPSGMSYQLAQDCIVTPKYDGLALTSNSSRVCGKYRKTKEKDSVRRSDQPSIRQICTYLTH